MPARKIMIVRHAEKPSEHGDPPRGVTYDGEHDEHALTPRGWQRAGALVRMFVPLDGNPPRELIEVPNSVYAAGVDSQTKSMRSQLTIEPTAAALTPALKVTTSYCPGEEGKLARAIEASSDDVCLICWEHKHIQRLVSEITSGRIDTPHWSGSRFDMVFVLTKTPDGWDFEQVPQLLLPGDATASVADGK